MYHQAKLVLAFAAEQHRGPDLEVGKLCIVTQMAWLSEYHLCDAGRDDGGSAWRSREESPWALFSNSATDGHLLPLRNQPSLRPPH